MSPAKFLRNKIPPKPNVDPEYEPYLKWNGKEWIMDYPEELETPETKRTEGFSSLGQQMETQNQFGKGLLQEDKGFSSQGEELANQGLLSAKDTKKETKIPILGSIPIIGNLFSSKSSTVDNSELVIMVSPKIINDQEVNVEL